MRKTVVLAVLAFPIIAFAQTRDTLTAKDIKAIEFSVKQKVIEYKVDRLVYNVQHSLLFQGSSGAEVLASTPLLKVDEEKGLVSIIGKSGVSVMVNDRMLNISGSELVNYLKNLRSENIARIEVITAPPAKYEALGNSGIINIVLRKEQNQGWSGYLNSYYVQTTYPGFGGAAALNYQGGKLRVSGKFRGYDTEKKSVENFSVIGNHSSISRDERRDMNDGLGINFSLDYTLTDKNNIGFIYDLAGSHSNMDIISTEQYFTGGSNTLNTSTNSYHRATSQPQLLNLYFDQKVGDHKLSLAANYYGNLPNTKVDFITTDMADNAQQIVRNLSSVDYNIYSTQADLTLNYKELQLETGLKYSQFSNKSDIDYLNQVNDSYISDPTKANLFDYDEKNYAAYISVGRGFGAKLSAKAGLRYEYAVTDGFSPTTTERTKNNYGKLFPTAYLLYKADDDNQFSVNYSKRINRPYFRALDPFRWYSNPYNYYAGNPALQPSFNHNFEFNYIFKNKLSAQLFYQRSIDSFDQITFLDDIYMVSTYYNYYNQNSYGLNLSYTDTFFKFWETRISADLSFSNTQMTRFNAVPFNGHSVYYSTNNIFRLNKAGTLFLFANYWQSLPSKDGNSSAKSNANLSAGLKTSLISKTLQANMSINDIFRQAGYRGSLYFTDNLQSFNNYWDARRFTLSITYNFGNQKVRANNRNVDFDESNRAK